MIALMCIKKQVFYMHSLLTVVEPQAAGWFDVYASNWRLAPVEYVQEAIKIIVTSRNFTCGALLG